MGRRYALPLAFLALLVLVAYWPALGGGILWDDDAHIPRPELQSASGLYLIWFNVHSTQQYYPLLFSWFWLQYQLWGDNMLGYHIVNVLLHVGAAFLVYLILQRLKIPGSLLAAAIFAVHPVHTESVAWITEQKNTLSAVFYLGAMLAYLRFDESRARSSYWLSLGLFAAALFSKTVAVTLPPALLIIFWWQRGLVSWQRDMVPLLPFFLLSFCDGLLTAWLEHDALGIDAGMFQLTMAQRIILAGRALWFYLGKLVWPFDLMFVYPRWTLDPGELWQWLFPIAAVALLVGCWALRNRTRAPLAAAAFFVLTLAPVLGVLNVYFFRYSFVTDHFQYLASLGPIVLLAAGLTLAADRLSSRTWSMVGCALLLIALTILTWQQSHFYGQDATHLYEVTIRQNPNALLARNNLGNLLTEAGRTDEAIAQYEAAIAIEPNYTAGHNNLGLLYAKTGRMAQAADYFARVVALSPDDAEAHGRLGAALTAVNRPAEAVVELRRAIELDPAQARYHNNLGNALLQFGRRDEAVAEYEAALRIDPTHPQARANLERLRTTPPSEPTP